MAIDPQASGPAAQAGTSGTESDEMWRKANRYDRRSEIVAVDWLTETGTVQITLRVTDDAPFAFWPGHFIAVEEEIPDLGPRRSPYCLFSPPSTDRRFELLIRVFPEGPLSQLLASLEPGDRLDFRGPSGRSMVPRDPDTELVMVGTGVGISPLRSLCRHLLAQGDRRRMRLFWGLRLTDDICLVDELDGLAARHRNFTYQISLSQPPPGWSQLRGRVTESVPPLLETLGGKRFYLCGNGAMVEEMEVALTGRGVDRHSIHEERFFNVRHQPDRATMEAIMSRFVADDLLERRTSLLSDDVLFPLQRDVKSRGSGRPPEKA